METLLAACGCLRKGVLNGLGLCGLWGVAGEVCREVREKPATDDVENPSLVVDVVFDAAFIGDCIGGV